MRYEFEERFVELLEDDIHIQVNGKEVCFSFYAWGYTDTIGYQKQTWDDPFDWEYDIDICFADWIASDKNEHIIKDKDVDDAISTFIDEISPYDWEFPTRKGEKAEIFESWKKAWKNAS